MLSLVPSARVAHIGLYRDPKTLVAVEYYFKAPEDIADRLVLVLDPMLATANSAIAAVDRLKEAGAKNIRIVCLLAAPEGIEKFHGHHPEVHIWTAAIDSHLNDHGYIVPGLGDAGDRMYGTKISSVLQDEDAMQFDRSPQPSIHHLIPNPAFRPAALARSLPPACFYAARVKGGACGRSCSSRSRRWCWPA